MVWTDLTTFTMAATNPEQNFARGRFDQLVAESTHMKHTPLFTVLMSVYAHDNADLFDKALASIYANTYLPETVLLVVDGPVGGNLETVVTKYEYQPSLKVVRCAVNQGLASALNTGLQHIKTEWVARADADDINMPDRFEKTFAFVATHPDIDIVSGNILEVDPSGCPIAERRVPEKDTDIWSFALKRNPFNHMATSYRLAKVLECGGYPLVHLKEDYALWCRMFQNGAKAYNLQDILVHATAGREMYKRRGGWRYAKAEYEMQQVLVQTGLKRPLRAAVDGLFRATIYLMPNRLRALVYEKLLRHKITALGAHPRAGS